MKHVNVSIYMCLTCVFPSRQLRERPAAWGTLIASLLQNKHTYPHFTYSVGLWQNVLICPTALSWQRPSCLPTSLLTQCLSLFHDILPSTVSSYVHSPLSQLLPIVFWSLLVSQSHPLGQALVSSVNQSEMLHYYHPGLKQQRRMTNTVIYKDCLM